MKGTDILKEYRLCYVFHCTRLFHQEIRKRLNGCVSQKQVYVSDDISYYNKTKF